MPYFTQTPHSFLPLPTIKDAYRKFEIKITFRPDSADGERERGCHGVGISRSNRRHCLRYGGPRSSAPCPGTPRPAIWALSRASSCLYAPLCSTPTTDGRTHTQPPVPASGSFCPPPSLFCLRLSAFPPLSLSLTFSLSLPSISYGSLTFTIQASFSTPVSLCLPVLLQVGPPV